MNRFFDLILVLVGFLLGFGADSFRRNRMRAAHWKILGAEVTICAERARQYLNGTVSAPLYRFPITGFDAAFPVLVSEADLAPDEFTNLIEYYAWAADINRGLEYAAEAYKAGDTARLQKEAQRIKSKCEKLLSEYLVPAVQTLGTHNVNENLKGRKPS